jgi:hypothetical protein
MSEKNLLRLLIGAPLPAAALAEDAEEYPNYALPTFIHWVKTNQRFRHQASGTWRGGPDGVRWVIGVYIHFAAAFSMYTKRCNELPTDQLEAFDSCNFSRLQTALVDLGIWLIESLRETTSVLKQSFRERAQGWRGAVVSAHLADPEASIGNRSVSMNTHGVPRSRSTIQECYKLIQQDDPEATLGHDSQMLQHLRRCVNKRAEISMALDKSELSNRNSLSGEEIELSSNNNSESTEDDTTLVQQVEENLDGGLYNVCIHPSLLILMIRFSTLLFILIQRKE